jgi:GT2 family glycosyltransferase
MINNLNKMEIDTIRKSGLVLEKWYKWEYIDLKNSKLDPVEHYFLYGWKEGRHPNPYFNTQWYQQQLVRDEKLSNQCPLLHYIENEKYGEVQPSKQFSVKNYLQIYNDVTSDPLKHYLYIGVNEGRAAFSDDLTPMQIKFEIDITGIFDQQWYKKKYADFIETSVDALDHFSNYGHMEGREPNEFFDTQWYKSHLSSYKEIKIPFILHYYKIGWKKNISPSKKFCVIKYLSDYPDVKKARMEPLSHYLRYGLQEGRIIREDMIEVEKEILNTELFLPEWYLNYYEDLKGTDIDPISHFVEMGLKEGRKPNPFFDTLWYVKNYGSQLKEDDNPLLFYSRKGWKLGHNPSKAFDALKYRAKYLSNSHMVEPLGHYLKSVKQSGNRDYSSSLRRILDDKSKKLELDKNSFVIKDRKIRALMEYLPERSTPTSNHFNKNGLDIHWVIPDFAPGAGGHMTIFRVVHFLELFGHKCTLWIYNPKINKTEQSAYDSLIKNFQHFSGEIKFVNKEFYGASGDVIFATDWGSVAFVRSRTNFKRRFYFVQDFEPMFWPKGTYSIQAEKTYTYDLDCICAGPWLAQLLVKKYGRWADYFWLAVDTDIYYPIDYKKYTKQSKNRFKIAFYTRFFTPRRAVELGFLALEQLSKNGDIEFEVHCFGEPLAFDSAPFICVDHGIISQNQLAELYRECDLGLVFSTTNYSLIPQEMMATHLPVAELDCESTRHIFPQGSVELLSTNPVDMSRQLKRLIIDEDYRLSIAEQGHNWIKSFSWQGAAKKIENVIISRLEKCGFRADHFERNTLKTSVVIPLLNGGTIFQEVLNSITTQVAPWLFEILIIDSGSSDGSLEFAQEFARNFKNIHIRQINQVGFQHDRIINSAVLLTTGKFIVFISQDAIPINSEWLFNLVTSLEHFPKAACAFGPHFAYPGSNPYIKRDLHNHFKGFDSYPISISKDTNLHKYESDDQAWEKLLRFYSNVNLCLRRSVLEKVPYPELDSEKNQTWMDAMIKLGYQKIYSKHAIVYHLHHLDEYESLKRSLEGTDFS